MLYVSVSQLSSTCTLVHVIPPSDVSCVVGVTSLNNLLFVACYSIIEVYDTEKFQFHCNLIVSVERSIIGLASCLVNNCLYVGTSNNVVLKVKLLVIATG